MRIALFAVVATAILSACATQPAPVRPDAAGFEAPLFAGFSGKHPGADFSAWKPWTFSRFKRPTEYALISNGGQTVVRARADCSASGLIHTADFDAKDYPKLSWRWKVEQLIDTADNTRAFTEDSPVRIVVAFDGDVSKLKAMDRLTFNQFRMFTKSELPYATLMYIWENKARPGTVIASSHTSRIKMIVAESGRSGVGEWRDQSVDLYADFRRAFGEEPGRVKWVGVMTDTDNTASQAQAYYGDIRVERRQR